MNIDGASRHLRSLICFFVFHKVEVSRCVNYPSIFYHLTFVCCFQFPGSMTSSCAREPHMWLGSPGHWFFLGVDELSAQFIATLTTLELSFLLPASLIIRGLGGIHQLLRLGENNPTESVLFSCRCRNVLTAALGSHQVNSQPREEKLSSALQSLKKMKPASSI